MTDEQREVIRWLNSWEGRKWSREKHQPPFGLWFCLKRDQELRYDSDPAATWDYLDDIAMMDLGWCDDSGRYRRPSRYSLVYGREY
jgi:hypothetical protein